MKRLLSVFVMFLVVVTVFAQDDSGELVIWTRYDLSDTNHPSAVALNTFIAAFEQETGYAVRHEQIAWDQMATRLAVATQAGGSVPDIVEIGSQHIPSLLDAGALMPLDDLLADEDWTANLSENDAQACTLQGLRYCVAHNMRGGITYYRVDDFPEGFPTTAQGWLDAIAQYAQRPYFSTQYAGRSYSAIETAWWPLIYSNSGSIFDDEGKPAWATEEVVEVVEFMRDLYTLDALPAVGISGDFSDAEIAWIEGDAGSFRGASWSAIFVPGIKDAVDSGEVAMTGGIAFGDSQPHVFLVGEAWIIPAGARNPEAARAWLAEFMQPDVLAEWAEAQYGVPTIPEAAEIVAEISPYYRQVTDILGEQGVFMQHSPYYLESLDALAAALQELLLNPGLDALERLNEAQDEILRRYW